MVECRCALFLLNQTSRNSQLPPILENLAPSLLNLLTKDKHISNPTLSPELVHKSLKILFSLLDSADPGLVRGFLSAEGRRLENLNQSDLGTEVKFLFILKKMSFLKHNLIF